MTTTAPRDTAPAFRDSGIPWFGDVPAHWQTWRLKYTVDGCINGVWGDEPDGGEGDTPCIRVADFDYPHLAIKDHDLTVRSIPAAQRASRSLRRGDLLIEKSGGGEQTLVGRVVQFNLDHDAVCSNFVARMRPTPEMDARFLVFFHAALYAKRLNYRYIKQTTGIQNLDSDAYLSEKVFLPPLPEQRAIAAFLDTETAALDALIARKERLIALLAEKRAAVIARTVTAGLDPAAPTKPTAIPWLGPIPAHWEVVRTKGVARLESGHTPSRQHPEYWVECTIPWVSLADVWQLRDGRREYVDDTQEYVSELGIANSSTRLLPAGTVIVSRTASVGFSGIISRPMATTQDFVNWVCGPRILSEYLLYVFRAMQPEFRRLIMGSTHQTIYMPDVGQFVTPVPPLDEQAAIVAKIRHETHRLDTLMDTTRRHIALLAERRAALIAAAVTGQIAVPVVTS